VVCTVAVVATLRRRPRWRLSLERRPPLAFIGSSEVYVHLLPMKPWPIQFNLNSRLISRKLLTIQYWLGSQYWIVRSFVQRSSVCLRMFLCRYLHKLNILAAAVVYSMLFLSDNFIHKFFGVNNGLCNQWNKSIFISLVAFFERKVWLYSIDISLRLLNFNTKGPFVCFVHFKLFSQNTLSFW